MAAKRSLTERTFLILAQEAIEGLQLNDAKQTYKSLQNNRNEVWSSFGELQEALSNKVELNEKIEDLQEEMDDYPDDEDLQNELNELLSSQSTVNLINDLEIGFNQNPQSFATISGYTVKINENKDKYEYEEEYEEEYDDENDDQYDNQYEDENNDQYEDENESLDEWKEREKQIQKQYELELKNANEKIKSLTKEKQDLQQQVIELKQQILSLKAAKTDNTDINEPNGDDIAMYQSVVYGNDQMILSKESKKQKPKKSKSPKKKKHSDKTKEIEAMFNDNTSKMQKNEMILPKNFKKHKAKKSKSHKKKKNKHKTKETERTESVSDNESVVDIEPIEVHTYKIQNFWNDIYVPDKPKSTKTSYGRSRGDSDCLVLKKNKKKTKKKSNKTKGRRRTQSVISSKKYGRNIISKYEANGTKKTLQSELLSEICQSLQFGKVSVNRVKKKNSKSDKLSFWFSILFHINHREKYFLYFYYVRDEYIKQKKSHFMPKKTRKSRLFCDLEAAPKSIIINHENDDIVLPKNILIEIFKYTKPRKLLELYAYNMVDDDNPFGNNHFVGSNLDWICNHFGIETVFIHKFLVKMLYFIYSPAIDQYIEKM